LVRTIQVDPGLSLHALQLQLRKIETVHGQVRALGHSGGYTSVVVEGSPPVSQIGLVDAQNGYAEIPLGSTLVCLGDVYVDNALKRVAAFRDEVASAERNTHPAAASRGDARRRQAPDAASRASRGDARRRQASDAPDPSDPPDPMQVAWVFSSSSSAKAIRIRGNDSAVGGRSATRTSAAKKRPAAVAAKKQPAASNKPTVDGKRNSSKTTRAPDPKPARTTMPVLEPREYRVWFGTNRKPADPADIAKGFSSERDGKVHYGHCDVYVPRSHKIGSIGKFDLIRWVTGKDDRLKIRRLAELAADDFWAGIRNQIEKAAPGARHAVVFIHGYRVSFKDAALRAAQIGFDLGIQGAMGFFSWPSKGTFLGYAADGSAIEASETGIADFLVDFARRSDAETVHVIAHSMGNRGLLRAANRIVADAARRAGCRFGQFILAAPDVDADSFRDLAQAYKTLAKRTTLYVSSKDLAVKLSRWIRDYARVGFHPPVTVVDGIDTVNVTHVDLTLLGHGYVAEARPVLVDMERLISTNQPPPRFGQEAAVTPEGRRYWNVRA
jgi:esterase/lipase superfamily enzyme